jgi:hypothetical protein
MENFPGHINYTRGTCNFAQLVVAGGKVHYVYYLCHLGRKILLDNNVSYVATQHF